jgi:hypothetical protein
MVFTFEDAMEITDLGKMLSHVLPKLRTTLQLSGFVVGLAFGLFVHFAKPGDNTALLCAAGVGISMIVFGQLFHFLRDFQAGDRPTVFLVSFGMFCVLIIALILMTALLLKQPSMTITPYTPSPEEEKKSRSGLYLDHPSSFGSILPRLIARASASDTTIEVPTLPGWNSKNGDPRSAKYVFSEVDGVATLRATLPYSEMSRHRMYPNADFNEAVDFGSPWLSFNVYNSSNTTLFLTSLKTTASAVVPIREVILNVTTGDSVDEGQTDAGILHINNEGWGRARTPLLDIIYVSNLGTRYSIVGKATSTLADLDDNATVNLNGTLPPFDRWARTQYCEGVIIGLATLKYKDDDGAERFETFRFHLNHHCRLGGGGNIFPSVFYNVQLPETKSEFPIFTSLADCIAAKSADRLVIRLFAPKSANYKLDFSLSSTSGVELERKVDIDILVARAQLTTVRHDGQFFPDGNRAGCT